MPIEKILVIQTAFIGDAVLTLPMIQFLANNFSRCVIDVIAIPSTAEVFSASPFVNEVIVIDKKYEHKSLWSILKIARTISAKNYTRIYSPHRSFRTSLIVLLSNVKETYGFSNSSIKHVYKTIIDYRYDFHEVRRNLELAGLRTDANNWKILPMINSSSEVIRKTDDIIAAKNLHDFIVIAPGSVWATKRYPEEYFKYLVDYFIQIKKTVVLLGSKEDFGICNSLSSNSNDVFNLAGELSLVESIELLKKAKLLICNDSAPTHLGMCANIPVVTIYCSTISQFGFYPYSDKSQYIGLDDLNCKPCGIHGHHECPLGNFDCGKKLPPQKIISLIEKILNNES